MREDSLIIEKPYKKQKETLKSPSTQPKYTTIYAKILSKLKTNLEDI
jgi:hypothetical protein